ncbi:hypothetical protein [Streptomyces sp. NPDC048392]|uniref:hypothetical protein n=1 Tax=Streptomyces sp. NPDC048392 TaxID=3365543 RepID=UPI00371F3061
MTRPPRRTVLAVAAAAALTLALALALTACGADTTATNSATGSSNSAVKDGAAVTTLDGNDGELCECRAAVHDVQGMLNRSESRKVLVYFLDEFWPSTPTETKALDHIPGR